MLFFTTRRHLCHGICYDVRNGLGSVTYPKAYNLSIRVLQQMSCSSPGYLIDSQQTKTIRNQIAEQYQQRSKQMRITLNLRKQISCLELGHVCIARDTSLVSFRTGGRKYQETTSVFLFLQHLQATLYMNATPAKQGATTANRKLE